MSITQEQARRGEEVGKQWLASHRIKTISVNSQRKTRARLNKKNELVFVGFDPIPLTDEVEQMAKSLVKRASNGFVKMLRQCAEDCLRCSDDMTFDRVSAQLVQLHAALMVPRIKARI